MALGCLKGQGGAVSLIGMITGRAVVPIESARSLRSGADVTLLALYWCIN
jgi:hypothetical protein